MKIIGNGELGGVLVSMSEEELANVLGYGSKWEYEREAFGGKKFPEVGDVVQVITLFRKLGALRDNVTMVVKAQVALRSVADILEPLTDVVERVTTPVSEEVKHDA